MRTSKIDFYANHLNTEIPEMKLASELFADGKETEADKVFADYVKAHFRKDKRVLDFNISRLEGTGKYSDEEYADMICEGYVYSVGHLYQFPGGIIDWTHNPTYNKYVEFSFHLQYHSELRFLASAYANTGNDKYAKRFDYMINSWFEQAICPENASGFEAKPLWRSIEAGGRMSTSWPYVITVFSECDTIPDTTWVNIFRSVVDHGHRLTVNCTKNAHNNWVINEMIGLAKMGVLYPFMKDMDYWREYAVKTMEDELDYQIQPDSMQVELTTGYHGGIIANYRIVGNFLKHYGYEFPKKFISYIKLLYSMYYRLSRPDRKTPGLNDGSEGDAVTSSQNALNTFPDDELFKYFATDGKEGKEPDFKSLIFENSGFVVMRTDWSRDAMWAMLDAGPEGHAHMHEDKLAVQIYAYRENMLADFGWYAYDTSDMRKYCITSYSHNTGLVDGMSQNRTKNHNWSNPQPRKIQDFGYRFTEDIEVGEGYYNEGYGENLTPVTHKRKLIFFKKGLGSLKPFFVVLDSFESNDENPHVYEILFHYPKIPVSAFSHSVKGTYGSGATLTIVSDKYPKIEIGQYAPRYMGWKPIHGTHEHEHIPTPSVSFAKKGLEAKFATILYSCPDSNTPEIGISLTDGGFEITVNGEKFVFDYTDERFKTLNPSKGE